MNSYKYMNLISIVIVSVLVACLVVPSTTIAGKVEQNEWKYKELLREKRVRKREERMVKYEKLIRSRGLPCGELDFISSHKSGVMEVASCREANGTYRRYKITLQGGGIVAPADQ